VPSANKVYIDIETEYAVDLKKHGAVYCASHPSARISCIAYAINDGPVDIIPYEQCTPQTLPKSFIYALLEVMNPIIVAHNAAFEREHLMRILGLDYLPGRWRDTMAKTAYYGYPRGLDQAAKTLRLTRLKDLQGAKVMKKLVTGKYTPETAPDDYAKLYSYCANDVEVTREIDKRLADLPALIQQWWELDCEINARGVPMDYVGVQRALALKNELKKAADLKMFWLTDGYVNTVDETERILAWLQPQGIFLPDMTADTVEKVLATWMPGMLPKAREVLELRQDAGLASLAKYEKMSNMMVDGRLYQMFKFYGAHTGRSAGYGPQLQNLPRSEEPDKCAEIVSKMPNIILQYDKPQKYLKDALRGMIMAPEGFTLLGVDLSQIEARATGWCANESKFLGLFGSSDPYCTYGQKIFNRPITKKDNPFERTASKATVLAFGFAGGIGAGQRVAENYKIDFRQLAGVVLPTATEGELSTAEYCYKYYTRSKPEKPLPREEATAVDVLKQRYRRDFPKIVEYWDQLYGAFLHGGTAGPISVAVTASQMRIVKLPSGRELFYHNVRQHMEEDEEGNYSYVCTYQTDKGRKKLWKGTIMENVAQGINADISEFYKLHANAYVSPVVHHCHDEFTMEIQEADIESRKADLDKILHYQVPGYETLPLEFDSWVSRRYGK